jgi:hypothetical protein
VRATIQPFDSRNARSFLERALPADACHRTQRSLKIIQSKYPPAEPGAYMRLRKSRVFLRDFPIGQLPFSKGVVRTVEQCKAYVCIHGMMALFCLAARSGQPPKPAGSRRRREGLTAKARAEQKSSCNGCLAVLWPPPSRDTSRARARDILVVVIIYFSTWAIPPIVATLELDLIRSIQGGALY